MEQKIENKTVVEVGIEPMYRFSVVFDLQIIKCLYVFTTITVWGHEKGGYSSKSCWPFWGHKTHAHYSQRPVERPSNQTFRGCCS